MKMFMSGLKDQVKDFVNVEKKKEKKKKEFPIQEPQPAKNQFHYNENDLHESMRLSVLDVREEMKKFKEEKQKKKHTISEKFSHKLDLLTIETTENDTLIGLAIQYNVSIDKIKQANGFTSDEIYPGMEIFIPVTKTRTISQIIELKPTSEYEFLCYYTTSEGDILGIMKITSNYLMFEADYSKLDEKYDNNDFNFTIAQEDLIDSIHYTIPTINKKKIENNYYVQIGVSNVGYYSNAKPFYKDMMDSWTEKRIPIAKIVIKIYMWSNPRGAPYTPEEMNKLSIVISAKINDLAPKSPNLVECSILLSSKTNIPYYDINFEISKNEDKLLADLNDVEDYIVVFENIFGLTFPNMCITDFTNHCLLPVRDVFKNGLEEKAKKKQEETRKRASRLKKAYSKSVWSAPEEVKEIKEEFVVQKFNYANLITEDSVALTEKLLIDLQVHLACYLRKNKLNLVYSNLKHGINIYSIYRLMENYNNESLLVIKDSKFNVFGGVLSHNLRMSSDYYGNLECFVFSYVGNDLKVYKPQQINKFYIFSNDKCLGMGGGKHPAIFIDSDLIKGETKESETFSNPPLLPYEDFEIYCLEIWTFDMSIHD